MTFRTENVLFHQYFLQLSHNTLLCSKLPGRKSTGPGGWTIQAKLQIYLWFGLSKHKKYLLPGIPKGYEMCYEFRNIERPLTLPPITLHYTSKQVSDGYTTKHVRGNGVTQCENLLNFSNI